MNKDYDDPVKALITLRGGDRAASLEETHSEYPGTAFFVTLKATIDYSWYPEEHDGIAAA